MARHLIKTDVAIRNTKSTDATLRLNDGDGLYLLIKPNGAKWWRLDYSIGGKRKTLSIGVYPDTGLKAARNKADEARQLVAAGTDPSDVRKASKVQQAKALEADKRIADGLPAVDSFEEVAREWFAKFSAEWAPSHADKIIRRLERDIFPWIGKRPIASITAPELLAALRRIEERGAVETAHRAHQNCGQIFRYAIATGRAERDPSPDLRGALPSVKQTHHAAITDPKAIGGLLRAIDGYQGYFVTKCALRIAPIVFVRPGELRKAEWAEIDLDKAKWNIPAERMKMREPHLVPLSTQAVEVLRELHALTGDGRYVFPGARTNGRPMSDNAILAALRRMGFAKDEMSGHGFRAMARTILDEVLQVRPDFIEHQLAHAVRDPNGRAYNRTAHLVERRKMMQQWADYLDKLKAGADVIPLHKKA
ncbi:MAG: integrase arm-type DNA-binding domain-containing protein [Proteobacteria bacterium]|nr:integrase arm-type DNA-binding domain-containing protein [Pseudomonadota bacterium]